MLAYCFVGFINALEIEEPTFLNDEEILNRYIEILEKNKRLLKNPNYVCQEGHNNDIIFKTQNGAVLRKLQNRRLR